ncbi:MAG: serpin family protein [Proteobacteria bacterium]|nr:serpin family protein [Pseudomonadota bacterium]
MKKTLLIALAIAACAFGCSKKQDEVQTPTQESIASQDSIVKDGVDTGAADVQENVKNTADRVCQLPEYQDDIDARQWADANNAFGFKLLAHVSANSQEKGNVVSPYSAERAIGMVLDGACGSTLTQIYGAMSLPLAKNVSAAGAEVDKYFKEEFGPNVTIDIDNKVWVEQTISLLDDYANSLKANYDIDVRNVDFKADPEGARKAINDDIYQATHEKISELIQKGMITSLTRAVLTNAIYFKAPWVDNFKPENTDKADFFTADGAVKVDMMHHTNRHRVYVDDKLTAVELRFAESAFALIVLMPTAGDQPDALKSLQESMDANTFRELALKMNSQETILSLPKFKIETSIPLNSLLKSLGMTTAFTDAADFSRMTGDTDLLISDVIQKAFIDVNENGAEAAAATAVVMRTKSMIRPDPSEPIKVTIDHPFMYALVEGQSGAILFLGDVKKI